MANLKKMVALLGAVLVLAGIGILGSSAASAAGIPVPETPRTCGEGPFSLTVFDQPAGYENEDTGLAKALRANIRLKWMNYPKRGWRLIYKDAPFAQVLSGDLDSEYREAITFKLEKGKWNFWRSGGCELEAYRPGATHGEWSRSTGQDYSRSTTSLRVDVQEINCNGGEPPRERVLVPTIEYFDEAIVVTYFIKTSFGFHTCPGAPPTTKMLELSEPLGDRKLLDGSTYPYPVRMSAPGIDGFFDPAPRIPPICGLRRAKICVTQFGPSRIKEGQTATYRVRITAKERLTGVKLRVTTGTSSEVERQIGGMRAGAKRTLSFQAGCPDIDGSDPMKLTTDTSVSFTADRRGKARDSVTHSRTTIACVPS